MKLKDKYFVFQLLEGPDKAHLLNRGKYYLMIGKSQKEAQDAMAILFPKGNYVAIFIEGIGKAGDILVSR